MNQRCVFCDIIAGHAPCSKVLENESVIAFLDIAPITIGHCLVVPKIHARSLSDLSATFATEMFRVAQIISSKLSSCLEEQSGFNLLLSDGKDAGQDVWHTHLHIIPRYPNDGFHFGRKHTATPTRKNLDDIAQSMKGCLS